MAARRSAEMSCVMRWVVRETVIAPGAVLVARVPREAGAALAVFCAGKRFRGVRMVGSPLKIKDSAFRAGAGLRG